MALFRQSPAWAFVASLVGFACGGDGGGGPGPAPNALAVHAGDNQVGPAGAQLTAPLAVRVTDPSGQPVANLPISWAVGTGGGLVSATSSNTDQTGVASINRTLGQNAGQQTTTATRSGLTGSPVTFTSIAQIQGATQIAANPADNGNGQSDTVRSTLATAYKVLVREQTNTPVQGVVVNWAVTGGGGSVSAATSSTNAAGIAQITHTLGSTAGAQTVRASVTGLIGSPVTFTSTAAAGNAASVEISGGNNQTGAVNSTLSTPFGVRARDAYGNEKPGVTVNWSVHAGSGSLNPTQSVTGPNGIATSARTLGPAAGTYTDTATSTGLTGSPLLFTVNAVTAPTTASVSIGNNFFNPNSVAIARTGSVTWTWNSAGTLHNVTFAAVAGAPSNIGNMGSGSDSRTFGTAGTFDYECTLHPGMTGAVTVVP